MKKEITDFLSAPWAFLIGAAAGLYYTDNFMKTQPSGKKKAAIIIGSGLAVHIGWKQIAKKNQKVYVEPINGSSTKKL